MGKRAVYWKLAKVDYCMSLEKVMECSLIKPGTYIKLCGSVDMQPTLNNRAVIQKDLDMLEEWADRNPHFCQHVMSAKLCAVCDTGAVA